MEFPGKMILLCDKLTTIMIGWRITLQKETLQKETLQKETLQKEIDYFQSPFT